MGYERSRAGGANLGRLPRRRPRIFADVYTAGEIRGQDRGQDGSYVLSVPDTPEPRSHAGCRMATCVAMGRKDKKPCKPRGRDSRRDSDARDLRVFFPTTRILSRSSELLRNARTPPSETMAAFVAMGGAFGT